MRQQLMHVAAATGVPYEVLTGDMCGVNDRTVRVILHEFRRRMMRRWQHQIVAFQLCRPILESLDGSRLPRGALPIPARTRRTRSRGARVKWMPQGWPYIHPVQDVDAQKAAIRAGLHLAQRGRRAGRGRRGHRRRAGRRQRARRRARPQVRLRRPPGASDPSIVDMHIIDVIASWDDDWIARNFGYDLGVTARAFVEALAALPEAVKTIRVHINSPGGDVFAALNIANALREQQTSKGRTVETIVDGLAASAASIVMMAGSKISIADNALVMVHNPWTIAMGAAKDMRKTADDLDTIRQTIVATYQWHVSELSADDIAALMDAETWMDADEAVGYGFATDKVAGLKAAAMLDPKAIAQLKVPEKFRARVEALLATSVAGQPGPKAATASDILAACETAGLPVAFARELVTSAATLEQAQARIATEQTRIAAVAQRSTDIRNVCTMARQPELADSYIAGGMTVDAVRAQLAVITAKIDAAVNIDGAIDPTAAGNGKARIDHAAVYAEMNKFVTK
jgi:ATP-dependent protease ClpP protease subunit